MQPICQYSFIIIIIIVVVVVVIVVVGHSKSFQPQKPRFSSFENNTGPSDGRTNGWTNGRTDQRTDEPTDEQTLPLMEMRGRI